MTAPDFASRLRELSAAASKGPWEAVVENMKYCDVNDATGDYVAEYIDDANAALIAFTRNRAERIADALDAVAAYRAARADGPVLSRTALEAMFAALDALEGDAP